MQSATAKEGMWIPATLKEHEKEMKALGLQIPGTSIFTVTSLVGDTTIPVVGGASLRFTTRYSTPTGLVVVGDLIGSGEAQERGIVGETPNLAARLQGLAEPDMLVIAEGTRKLLGNLFELQYL